MTTNMRQTILTLAVLFPSIASAAHLDPVLGNWVGEGLSCSALEDGGTDKVARIEEESIVRHESECDIREVRVRGSKFIIDTLCRGEGTAWQEVVTLERKGSKLLIDGDGLYIRCEPCSARYPADFLVRGEGFVVNVRVNSSSRPVKFPGMSRDSLAASDPSARARHSMSQAKDDFIARTLEVWNPGKTLQWRKEGVDLVIDRREGYYLYDMDGRRLINLHLNGGIYSLGHRNPEVIAAVKEGMDHFDIGNHHFPALMRTKLAEMLRDHTPEGLQYSCTAPAEPRRSTSR